MALLPLFTGAYIHIISYTGTGYIHMRSWYWTAQMMLVTLVFWHLPRRAAGDARLVGPRRAPTAGSSPGVGVRCARPQQVFAALLGAGFVLYCAADIVVAMPMFIPAENERGLPAAASSKWRMPLSPVRSSAQPAAGVIAYFVEDRMIVNMDGLMNTIEYFHLLQKGQAPANTWTASGCGYVYTATW